MSAVKERAIQQLKELRWHLPLLAASLALLGLGIAAEHNDYQGNLQPKAASPYSPPDCIPYCKLGKQQDTVNIYKNGVETTLMFFSGGVVVQKEFCWEEQLYIADGYLKTTTATGYPCNGAGSDSETEYGFSTSDQISIIDPFMNMDAYAAGFDVQTYDDNWSMTVHDGYLSPYSEQGFEDTFPPT